MNVKNKSFIWLCLLVAGMASSSQLGAWKTKNYWLLGEGERIGGSVLAGGTAFGLGALWFGALTCGCEDSSWRKPAIAISGAVCAVPALIYVYWKLGKLKPKARLNASSERIAKLLENDIIFPLENKDKADIDVSDDIETHFVDDTYPLASAKYYLDAMSRGMMEAAGLASAVAEYSNLRLNLKKLKGEDLKKLLQICSAGCGDRIEKEFLEAMKVGAKRLRPVIKKILLALSKDPRFEEQRRSADRERQHQEEMRIRREHNDIRWSALLRR